MKGQVIPVPVFEAPGQFRVGRFGWKNQQASLLSFSSDAYLNEQGITNQFNLQEPVPAGTGVGGLALCDDVPDNAPCKANTSVNCGEHPDGHIQPFPPFMRATKAPGPHATPAATSDAQNRA